MDVTKLRYEFYRQAFQGAKADLASAREERDKIARLQGELELRIKELRRTIVALAALCGETFEDEDDDFGLTDSIRMVMRTSHAVLNAQQVKARLELFGYRKKSVNLLASVHTILRRLAQRGELDDTALSDGKQAYQWIPVPSEGPSATVKLKKD